MSVHSRLNWNLSVGFKERGKIIVLREKALTARAYPTHFMIIFLVESRVGKKLGSKRC